MSSNNRFRRTVSAPEIRRLDQTMPLNPAQPLSSTTRGAGTTTFVEWLKEAMDKERNDDGDDRGGDYSELLKALGRKDWKEVEDFVSKNPAVLSASFKEGSATLLHFMADYADDDKSLRLMKKFVGKISASDLEKKDACGCTPLFTAALGGNTEAAKILVEKNENLPNMKGFIVDLYPIQGAAFSGHRETVEFLRTVTEEGAFTAEYGYQLVLALITSDFIDVAFNLLKRYPKLARESINSRGLILQSLAIKPKFFESGCRFGRWKRFIYRIIPVQKESVKSLQSEKNDSHVHESVTGDMEKAVHNSSTKTASTKFGALIQKIPIVSWNVLICLAACCFKDTYDTKLMHIQSAEIVRMMCDGVTWTIRTASETLKNPVLAAAKFGIYEIVNEVPYTNILLDAEENDVRMLAVLHRREKLFRILLQKKRGKKSGPSHINKFGNNVLHLAGGLVPSGEVAGAALQMQRELQWFKVVGNCYPSLHQDQLNIAGKTPSEVFMESHKGLVKEGETWMKDTARAYSVVVSLIITTVFAAAFNVPGGRKTEGPPVLLHDVPFIVFMVSDVLALFSSTTSLLLFLRILTSRYAQEEFLESLPKKLMYGLISMFFSIVAMLVAFGATVYIVLSNLLKSWVIILVIAVLGCIPIAWFAGLQIPFLLDIFFSTCRPSLYQPLKIRM